MNTLNHFYLFNQMCYENTVTLSENFIAYVLLMFCIAGLSLKMLAINAVHYL